MVLKLAHKKDFGLVFVVSAPAGAGKTTLVRMLANEFPSVVESVSLTTRPPRPGEVDGVDYHFVSPSVFDEKVEAGDFLEHAEVFGNGYGTSKSHLESLQKEGKDVFLVIDIQGARQVMEKIQAVSIFIFPPSMQELERRLASRKTEDVASIERRLSCAKKEMEAASFYHYHIINDDLHSAYDSLRSILIAESHRVRAGSSRDV